MIFYINFRLAILLFLIGNIFCNVRIDPLVDTTAGLIRGLRASDGDYSMFMGIPYAKVNDTNPFGASIPITKFDKVFEAYHDSKACPQEDRTSGDIFGDLDCLQLNVYVPNTANTQNKVPVMVWIHGGFFSRGSSSRSEIGPKHLVNKKVILVTVHYRLGPYGFMCLDSPEVPGNQGLKDQHIAIQWIKNNIEAFGGDAAKITLFGVSAGGHSIDLHLLSQHRILFNNVILQSGSSLASTVFVEHDKLAPIKLSEKLGFIMDSIDDALIFLTNTEPTKVIKAVVESGLEFKPCAEKTFENVTSFITESWVNTDSPAPNIKNLPILVGFNSKEQANVYADRSSEYLSSLNVVYDELKMLFDFNGTELVEMENYVRHFYLGDNEYIKEYKDIIGNFNSDHTYIHPIHRSIRRYLENSAKSIFFYMFSYRGGRNFIQNKINDTIDGTIHSDELGYLFDTNNATNKVSDADNAMIEKMTTMWANFAKYSDPTPESTELLPITWLPVKPDRWNYLNINSELRLSSRPYHRRMAFWDLFYKLNEKKHKGYVNV